MAEQNGDERDDKGRFGRGNKASVGRGQNKVSSKVKEAIVGFLEGNIHKIQEDFDSVKPRERLQFISDILPYAVPKLSSVQSEVDANITGGITIKWEDPYPGQGQSST